ncbi:MAG: hypothetical protein NTV87_12315, partial [Ignavibacteriae bacterium]|nr:hypothetical protein [Ignavibacteriota bacterium]
MKKLTVLLIGFAAIVTMLTYGFDFPFTENSTGFNTVKVPSNFQSQDAVNIQLSEGLNSLRTASPGDSVKTYVWSQSTSTYTSISSTGTFVISGSDDNSFAGLPIGFNFIWAGPQIYNTFGLNSNGWISMGSVLPVNSYVPLSTGTTNNVISAFTRDLQGLAAGNGIYYQTTGTAPNRVLTVEWKNWGAYLSTGDLYNFQIKLYETSNNIQIVYGPYTAVLATAIQAGLRGISGDFNNRATVTPANWSTTIAGLTSADVDSVSAAIIPPNGLTWTWTAPAYTPMVFSSSTTTGSTAPVSLGSVNNSVIGMQVVTTGYSSMFEISQLNLTTTGSTNPVTDIRNAKVYYTGTSPVFSTALQYGTVVTNPNGVFSVSGSLQLFSGINYFWLTYDVPVTGTMNNFIDATCESIVGSGTMGTVIPVPTAPPGARQILNPMSGNYNVGLGQTFPNFATLTDAVTNLNNRGVSGPVTLSVKPGVYGTAAGLEGDSTFSINTITGASAVNTITFKRKSDEAGMVWVERVGTAGTTDFIFQLNGASYITFDSINVRQKDTTLYNGVDFGYYIIPSSPTVGSQYNTIRNCNIGLNKSNTATKGIYQFINALVPTAPSGTNSYNRYYSNIIYNTLSGIYIAGYAAALPYNLYDQNTEVGVDGGNNITNFGGSAVAVYGIIGQYQRGFKLANNTIIHSSVLSTSTTYGILTSTGNGSNVDIYNNTISFTGVGPATTCYGINNLMGSTALGNHVNIYNNSIINYTLGAVTSAAVYLLYNGASADTVNIYNNNISNNTIGGTGTVYSLSQAGAANTVNIYGNTLNNIQKTGTGTVYGIYPSSISTTLGVEKVYNNTVTNIGSSSTSTVALMYLISGPINRYVNGNILNNSSTAGATFYGIYQLGGINNFIFNNKINNLTSNNASAALYGIYNSSGTFVYTFNNFISNLNTPVSTSLTSATGLYILTPSAYIGAFHNSIYLNSTSSGAAFGNSGVYVASSATNTVDLRNNNIVNASTPGATGRTVGIRYSSAVYTNYYSGSGANNIYMGLGVPNYLRSYFYDGTNSDSAINKFRDRVTPREQSSVSENPAFVNAAAGDLHISAGASLLKQGGYAVTSVPSGPAFSVTTDIDGAPRGAIYDDIGADEFTGTRIVGTAPRIAYVPLGTGNTSARTLSDVGIQDPEGVDNTNKPRIYYKKSTNSNILPADNTSATDGWKYAVTTSTSAPYSFTIDYSIIFGSPVANGDIINYFVVAQDLAGTPNVGINAGAFTLLPASVNLTAAAFPVTNFGQYLIAGSLSAGINVGTGQTYTSLTGAAPTGLFAAMNSGELTGNLTVNIISDLAETGVNALNQWNEQTDGIYSLTIKAPDTATFVRNISGWVANSLIRLNGPSGVTIDGGTGKYLRFRQMTVAQPTFLLTNGTQNVNIKNCIIEGSNTSTTVGIVSLTTANTALGRGNSNITFDNNNISARSDTLGPVPNIGISSIGTASPGLLNTNITITNNNIFNFGLDGVYATTGNGGPWVIKKNSFYYNYGMQMATSTIGWTAVFFNHGVLSVGNTLDSNYVGGSAPLCAGSPTDLWLIEPQCFYMSVGYTAQSTIRGNIIKNMRSRWMLSSTVTGYGIQCAGGWIDVSGNYVGSTDTAQSIVTNHNFRGIYCVSNIINPAVTKPITIFNNTVNNIYSRSDTLCPSALVRAGIVWGGNADVDVIGNTVSNFETRVNPNITANSFSMYAYWPNSGGKNTVINNVVYNFGFSTNQLRTSTGRLLCFGMYPASLGGGSIISGNKISKLYINGPSSSYGDLCYGMYNYGPLAGTSMTVSNNQISLLENNSDTTIVFGIYDGATLLGGINNYSYNTILIGGTVLTNAINNSGAYWKGSATCSSVLRNNIFYNGRTGGSTGHVAIGTANLTLNRGITPITETPLVNTDEKNPVQNNGFSPMGPVSPRFDSDYNLLVAPSNIKITSWYDIYQNFPGWQTASGGDSHSYSDTVANVPMANLFRGPLTGNLNIDSSNAASILVADRGTPLAGITTDFNGNIRNATTPDIGSSEFTYTLPISISLLSPTNGATGLDYAVNLVWTKSIFAASYRLQISTDPAFATTAVDTNVTDTTYLFTGSNYQYFWRVNLVNAQYGNGPFSPVFNFSISTPTRVTLVAPSNGAVDLPVTIRFIWNKAHDGTPAPDRLTSGAPIDISSYFNKTAKTKTGNTGDNVRAIGNYMIRISADTTSAPVYVDSTLTDTTTVLTGFPANQRFFWNISAKNEFRWGATSEWFTAITIPMAGIPVLISPPFDTTGMSTSPKLIWARSFKAATYTVQMSTDSLFGTLMFSDSLKTDTVKAVSGLFKSTKYFWRVQAVNGAGYSDWAYSKFTTANTPTPVTLVAPNNVIHQPIGGILFTWRKLAFLNLSGYWFEATSDTTSATPFMIDSTFGINDTSTTKGGWGYFTNYYWRVKAKNDFGWGDYSLYFKFQTEVGPPNLVYPANNALGIVPTVTLDWDNAPGAATYRMQLSADSTFASTILNVGGLPTSQYTVPSGFLTILSNYFWRVNSTNAQGTSIYSSVFKFRTMGQPLIVNLVTPVNNAVNIAALNTVFNWNKGVDQTFGIVGNKGKTGNDGKELNSNNTGKTGNEGMELNSNNTGKTGNEGKDLNAKNTGKITNGTDEITMVSKYWFELVTDTIAMTVIVQDTTLTDTTKTLASLDNMTAFYFRVKGKNEIGWGSFSTWNKFTTTVALPTLLLPANTSTDVTLTPSIDWSDAATATSYDLQVSADPGFATFVYDITGLPTSNYTVPAPLNVFTNYYWRVRATNANGTSPYYSASFTFRTVPTAPLAPALLVPLNGSTGLTLPVALQWSKVNDAYTYRLQVATDAGFTALVFNDSTITDTSKVIPGLQPV